MTLSYRETFIWNHYWYSKTSLVLSHLKCSFSYLDGNKMVV